MRRFLRNNGLTVCLMALFLVTWACQYAPGFAAHNRERVAHGRTPLGAGEYWRSGHFWQTTGENWESKFLQMAVFTLLTAILFQKGSPESKDPDEPSAPESGSLSADTPWPVRRGGLILHLYRHSLSLTFLICFVASIVIHAAGGLAVVNEENATHGEPAEGFWDYVKGSQFWFESFQNWQSEFLSLAAMVFLSVYLREAGRAESKAVSSPHHAHE